MTKTVLIPKLLREASEIIDIFPDGLPQITIRAGRGQGPCLACREDSKVLMKMVMAMMTIMTTTRMMMTMISSAGRE